MSNKQFSLPTFARLVATFIVIAALWFSNAGISLLPVYAATPAQSWQEEQFSIGASVQGRPLTVYKLGNGPVRRVLIGSIHGGFEWNTAALMTRTLTYLRQNPALIPSQVTVYILPIANPDGFALSRGFAGRVNANKVDLNRNWDYIWQTNAWYGRQPISGGTFPASEPETVAMRNFLTGTLNLKQPNDAVIFYHSAFSAIFAGAGVRGTRTTELAQVMSKATGYRILRDIPGQFTTGDAIDYLTAKAGITAIEIELRNSRDMDWAQNQRGLIAFLNWGFTQPD
jgi:predicted deacylase